MHEKPGVPLSTSFKGHSLVNRLDVRDECTIHTPTVQPHSRHAGLFDEPLVEQMEHMRCVGRQSEGLVCPPIEAGLWIGQRGTSGGSVDEVMRRGYGLADVFIAVDDVPQPVGCLAFMAAVLRLLTSLAFPQDAALAAGVASVTFEDDGLSFLLASWDII